MGDGCQRGVPPCESSDGDGWSERVPIHGRSSREEIMKKFATYLFPDLDWPAQRKRMKCVINGIGLDAWKAKYGDSQGR
eukprot:1532361-Prymnesium_polylepis.1